MNAAETSMPPIAAARQGQDRLRAPHHVAPPAAAAAATGTAVAPLGAESAPRSSSAGQAPTSPEPAAVVALRPGEFELCGYGIATAGSQAAEELERAANANSDEILFKHLSLMRNSADPPTRAAGLMGLHDYAPLVDMALHTSDATVYALALAACATGGPIAGTNQSCLMLSAERAAQLDPDNAAAWVDLAAAAQQRHETDAVAAAIYRASVATQVQGRSQMFAALALAALPAHLPPPERTSVVVRLIGIQAGLLGTDYRSVVTYCSAVGMTDSNRRQTCEALAELLVARGTTVVDLAIGRSIGARAGWPAERVEQLSARVEAYMWAPFNEFFAAPRGPMSCASMRRTEQWWSAPAGKGQRAYAEEAVARAGLSDADLVARYREQLRHRAQAAAAASAASALR